MGNLEDYAKLIKELKIIPSSYEEALQKNNNNDFAIVYPNKSSVAMDKIAYRQTVSVILNGRSSLLDNTNPLLYINDGSNMKNPVCQYSNNHLEEHNVWKNIFSSESKLLRLLQSGRATLTAISISEITNSSNHIVGVFGIGIPVSAEIESCTYKNKVNEIKKKLCILEKLNSEDGNIYAQPQLLAILQPKICYVGDGVPIFGQAFPEIVEIKNYNLEDDAIQGHINKIEKKFVINDELKRMIGCNIERSSLGILKTTSNSQNTVVSLVEVSSVIDKILSINYEYLLLRLKCHPKNMTTLEAQNGSLLFFDGEYYLPTEKPDIPKDKESKVRIVNKTFRILPEPLVGLCINCIRDYLKTLNSQEKPMRIYFAPLNNNTWKKNNPSKPEKKDKKINVSVAFKLYCHPTEVKKTNSIFQ